MPGAASVVVGGCDVDSRVAQRQAAIVEIEKIRAVLVDQVQAAQLPLQRIGGIVRRRGLDPLAVVRRVPVVHGLEAGDPIRDHHARAGIELLRIQALPPLALAVGLGQAKGVIALAGQGAFRVVAIGCLPPVPGMGRVVADAEAQACIPRHLGPGPDDVAPGPHPQGVPGVMFRRPGVEVVVVVGQGHEILRARGLVEPHQRLWVPVLGLPQVLDLHEAEAGRVAVGLDVVLVEGIALDIHQPPVPVAELGHALRAPMGPDPQLGVAIPVRRLILRRQRLPGRAERTGLGLSQRLGFGQGRGRGQHGAAGLQQASTREAHGASFGGALARSPTITPRPLVAR